MSIIVKYFVKIFFINTWSDEHDNRMFVCLYLLFQGNYKTYVFLWKHNILYTIFKEFELGNLIEILRKIKN